MRDPRAFYAAIVFVLVCAVIFTLLANERDLICHRFPLDDIVYINLARRPDRMDHCVAQFSRASLHVRRVDAVDGQLRPRVDPGVVRMDYDLSENAKWDPNVQRRGHQQMSTGEVGCCLSHRNVWIENDTPILIFEDDVVLADRFVERVRIAFSDLPDQWDILYLGYINDTGGLRSRRSAMSSLRPVEFVFGGYAYALSSSGRAKLSARTPIDRPLDNFLGSLTESGYMIGYAVDPPLVTQLEFGGPDSDIRHSAIEESVPYLTS